MKNNNCKDCEYWVDDDDTDLIMHPIDPHTRNKIRMLFDVRKCNHPSIMLFERNPNPAGVSLCDGEDYRAEMYTGPMFGCVNFKQI